MNQTFDELQKELGSFSSKKLLDLGSGDGRIVVAAGLKKENMRKKTKNEKRNE